MPISGPPTFLRAENDQNVLQITILSTAKDEERNNEPDLPPQNFFVSPIHQIWDFPLA